jgi:hypothetical protein
MNKVPYDYNQHGYEPLGDVISEDMFTTENGQLTPNFYYKSGILLYDNNKFSKKPIAHNEAVVMLICKNGLLLPICDFTQHNFDLTSIYGVFNHQIKSIEMERNVPIQVIDPIFLWNIFKMSGGGFLGSIVTGLAGALVESVVKPKLKQVKGVIVKIAFEDKNAVINTLTFEIPEKKAVLIKAIENIVY